MRNDFESNYLAHHGILGQKWGVMNGPPYPLGSGDHSAREKREKWKKSLGNGRNEELYDRKKKIKSSSNSSDKKAESQKKTVTKKTEIKTAKSDNQAHDEKKHTKLYEGYVKNRAEAYKEKYGLSDMEANQKAQQNAELMKKCLIGTGIAVAAVAGTAALVYAGRNYVGYSIKAGTTLQTLSHDPDRLKKGIMFYTSFMKSDQRTYLGMFGRGKVRNAVTGQLETRFKSKINANVIDDIKIPSRAQSEALFNKVFSSPEAQEKLLKIKLDITRDINNAAVDKGLTKSVISQSKETSKYIDQLLSGKLDYNMYNKHVIPLDESKAVTKYSTRINSIFKEATLKEGFDGVLDVNDTQKARVLRSLRPTIVFNQSKVDVANQTVSKVNPIQKYGNMPGAWAKSAALRFLQDPVNAVTLTALQGLSLASMADVEFEKRIKEEKDKKSSANKA